MSGKGGRREGVSCGASISLKFFLWMNSQPSFFFFTCRFKGTSHVPDDVSKSVSVLDFVVSPYRMFGRLGMALFNYADQGKKGGKPQDDNLP